MRTSLLIVLACAAVSAQAVIERVLARVDGAVIMLTDVRAAVGLGLVDVPAGPGDEQAALDRLIDRHVLLGEVARFSPPAPTDAAIDDLVAAMKARAGAQLPALMQATGIDDLRIRELARDTLRLQSYVKQRFGVAATLSDPDVRQWIGDTRKRATVILSGQ